MFIKLQCSWDIVFKVTVKITTPIMLITRTIQSNENFVSFIGIISSVLVKAPVITRASIAYIPSTRKTKESWLPPEQLSEDSHYEAMLNNFRKHISDLRKTRGLDFMPECSIQVIDTSVADSSTGGTCRCGVSHTTQSYLYHTEFIAGCKSF